MSNVINEMILSSSEAIGSVCIIICFLMNYTNIVQLSLKFLG